MKQWIALAAGVMLGVEAAPAWAVDVRPSGYLERGQLISSEEGPSFLPDAESGSRGGRYFRVGGYDNLVTYGLGNHPVFDWVWPSYHLKPTVRDLMTVSPGGLDRLIRYEEAQANTEGLARIGSLILAGAAAAAIGGLIYNQLPNNAREMQPSFWYGTAAAGALGLTTWGGSTWVANQNLELLDAAIEAYNREMAGRRRLAPLRPAP